MAKRGLFDGLPISEGKSYLKEELSRIGENWIAPRFDSLPHVVHILTSKDREGEIQYLKDQSEIVEEVVDEVVHAYHGGFNKAIQNYSHILRLFTESAESIVVLKGDLAEAKQLLGSRNKQLHQLWYRSVTLRHIISLLDQIESIAKVPDRIEKLIAQNQLYAAVQLHAQSMLMLEREGLQVVGTLQDVRSELNKLRGILFFKVLEDLHSHLYNKGEYSLAGLGIREGDEVAMTMAMSVSTSTSQPLSRRTRSTKIGNQFGGSLGDAFLQQSSVDGSNSFDGHDEENSLDFPDGLNSSARNNGVTKDSESSLYEMPAWLSGATPDEFLESVKKSEASLHVKYLQTLVECLLMLGKVAAAGAILCQKLRPTIHEIITSKIKSYGVAVRSSKPLIGQIARTASHAIQYSKEQFENFQVLKRKIQNGPSSTRLVSGVSPVSPVLAPSGTAQASACGLLSAVLDAATCILENHIVVGELLESKSVISDEKNSQKVLNGDATWIPDSDPSQVTGGYTVGFSLTVIQSECQQLICEILRATPEAASADTSVQTARLASKTPSKEKRNESEEGFSFTFRFTDAAISIPSEGNDLIRGWNRKGTNIVQEGYGTAAVLPELGIYLAASIYRPVVQFTNKVASILPQKYSQLWNDGLQTFVENFLKDHFLPTIFVDYRKSVQQAISSPAAFRPRTRASLLYTSSVEKGRPVLQGLLAIDFLAKEVLGWAQTMPKFASELVEYVRTFLERAYERCRASYMEAVLEKQSYMLIGRHDIESLMRLDPANAYLPSPSGRTFLENNVADAETMEIEAELSDLLFGLRPIKQENLIRDDNKLILLASLSDSLEYVADSIGRLGQSSIKSSNYAEKIQNNHQNGHTRTGSTLSSSLASLADEYRGLAVDCLKVLRLEMQLESIFYMQELTMREYLDNQDAEEPDDFVITLAAQITRREEEMIPFVAPVKRMYIFGGICSAAANAFIKALAGTKCINLFGIQQICRDSIALEQALAAMESIDSDGVRQRLDRVRTYYELLNLPFEALIAFITDHEYLFTSAEYSRLVKVNVPGREIPENAERRVSDLLSR